MMSTGLKRSLGLWAAYSTSVGLVVSGTAMVALGNGFGTTGLAFVIAAFVGLIIITMVVFSYAELTAMMPGSGMIGEFTLPALGRLPAIFAVLGGYLVLVAADGGTQMIIGGHSMEKMTGAPSAIFSWLILTILVVINMLGIEVFGRVEVALSLSMIAILGLIGLLGGLGLGGQKPVANPFLATDLGTVAQMGAVAIWLYIGMEFVCPLAEEVHEPWKNIPRGMILGVFSIFVVDSLFGWGATRFVDLAEMASSSTPQIVGAEAMFGTFGRSAMAVVTVFAAFSTGNAELAAVPRMLYGLANEGLLPRAFTYLHPTRRAPWVGIIVTAGLMATTLVYATFTEAGITLILTLISVAATTWLLSYIIAQVDVIVLRRRVPNAARPFTTPLYPVPQVLGIGSCVYLILFIVPDLGARIRIWITALAICVVIVAFGVWWLRRQHLPLFAPTSLDDIVDRINRRREGEDEGHETGAPTAGITDDRDGGSR